MKFTCERCSKRFSSVDDPMPGRVYRIRCRCGNVIQITAPHSTGATRLGSPAQVALDGARPAPPAVRPVVRRATPAGDAGAPVRHAEAEARTPVPSPPAAARPAPIPRPARVAPRDADPLHPLATPIEALAPEAAPARIAPRPAAPAAPAPPRDGAAPPARARPSRPSAPPREAPLPRAAVPRAPSASDDPFEIAATHASLPGGDFETAAPGISALAPRDPVPADAASAAAPTPVIEAGREEGMPSPEAPDGSGPPQAELPAAAAVPAAPAAAAPPEAEETSVELSVSEQYALPRPPEAVRSRRRGLLVGALVIVCAVGGAGAYVLGRGGGAPGPAAATAAATPAASRPVEREPEHELAARAARAESERAEAAAREEAARADAARVAEEAARAEAARAEAAAAEAEAARAEAARAAEAARRDEAERSADAERRAEAVRKAEAERKADAERRAAAERAARAAKQAATAARAPAKPAPAVSFERAAEPSKAPATPPAVDPAVAEALRRKADPPPRTPEPLPEGLDPSQMQTVIRANRAALEECAAGALANPATAGYAGSKVVFVILVAPNGRAEAALEDPALDGTPFGACLRRAASRMTFPAFRGEPVGARIPLRIGAAP